MTIQPKKPRAKTCINPECGVKFTPMQMGQKVCGWKCGLAVAPAGREKAQKAIQQREKAEHRERKEKVKSKGKHAKAAQDSFNAWIRERDKGLPCISCGTTADVQYAAGHYKPSGSNPALRFEPLNVHLQCNRNCNMAKSGNLGPYRVELIKRIGQEKVDWLEGPHEPKRYTIEDLQAIKALYRKKLRELKNATQQVE